MTSNKFHSAMWLITWIIGYEHGMKKTKAKTDYAIEVLKI